MTGRARRLALLTVIGVCMMGLYLLIGHTHRSRVMVLSMPDEIPFVPALALPYLALLNAALLLPLGIRNERLFHQALLAGILAYLLVVPWWLLFPSVLPRPPVSGRWWNLPYRCMIAIDAPTNVFPCAHVLGPVIAVWYAAIDRPAWRWWLVGMLLLGIPTIALTWQHRPLDIVIGILCAALGILLASRILDPPPLPSDAVPPVPR